MRRVFVGIPLLLLLLLVGTGKGRVFALILTAGAGLWLARLAQVLPRTQAAWSAVAAGTLLGIAILLALAALFTWRPA
jgi:hypothetical protein